MTPPRRGEVWLVDLGMAAKVRPAVVISIPAEDTDRALVTLVPHTTSPRQSRFEAAVSVSFLRVGTGTGSAGAVPIGALPKHPPGMLHPSIARNCARHRGGASPSGRRLGGGRGRGRAAR